jgi:hypothetical protein
MAGPRITDLSASAVLGPEACLPGDYGGNAHYTHQCDGGNRGSPTAGSGGAGGG